MTIVHAWCCAPPPAVSDASSTVLCRYYMPQMQGLMDIFDRDWCDAWVWTPGGAGLFRIPRDRQYWAACYEVRAPPASWLPVMRENTLDGAAAAAQATLLPHLVLASAEASRVGAPSTA